MCPQAIWDTVQWQLRNLVRTPEQLKELCRSLLHILVRPYYVYRCDQVVGTDLLQTNVWKGVEVMESLRGHTTGSPSLFLLLMRPAAAAKSHSPPAIS